MPSWEGVSGPIGVFDSGFGGLNTLRHLVGRLPAYNYLYLGDAARAPYGPQAAADIRVFTEQAIDFLHARGCRLIIFACNTASSDALHAIQAEYVPRNYPGTKVLGVLIPLAEEAVARTCNKKVGIIATEGTVRSGAFVREIKKLDPAIRIFQQAAPALVPLIEAGDYRSHAIHGALEEYLKPLIREGIDTLVLGCTHYEIMKDDAQQIAGPSVNVISEGRIVAERLAAYLARHPEVADNLGRGGSRTFYSTGRIERFDALGSAFFGSPIRARAAVLA